MSRRNKKKVPPLTTQMAEHIDEYGWCRANQHIWKPNTAGLVVNKNVVTIVYTCGTCGGERADDVSLKTGELLNRSYRQAQGYLMVVPEGQKKPSKTDWRREHFRHIVKGVK